MSIIGGEIENAPGAKGIERTEVRFKSGGFSAHRHDSYAVGIILSGELEFKFRKETWRCQRGSSFIISPDELHDGRPGTSEDLRYRVLHVDPVLVWDALDRKQGLPFFSQPIVSLENLPLRDVHQLWAMDGGLDDVECTDLMTTLVKFFLKTSSGGMRRVNARVERGISLVREFLLDKPFKNSSMEMLEEISGIDRWTIAREFRNAYGTSPSRFRTMRRLEFARRLMTRGFSLSGAAMDSGFADQSHMSRQFKMAYGITPAQWLSIRSKRPVSFVVQ